MLETGVFCVKRKVCFAFEKGVLCMRGAYVLH